MQKITAVMVMALWAVLVLFALPDSATAAKRVALVVGNSKYTGIGQLKNASNDAAAISKKLKKLGFNVTLLKDARSEDFWIKLDKFVKKAEKAESVLFFYSGHAFQLNGTNYLVPVDAKLQSAEAITTETWSLNGIIQRLQDRNRQTLIFLDACRNNPLPESARTSGASANGLARLQTGTGTFVAFATTPGDVTFDGTGKNSPFTTALLDNIATPGISISDMMIEVRNDVEEKTFRKQIPWDQSSLRSQFYFKEVREKRPGLTTGDFEMLASLPAADREKMLKLLEASGIDTSAMDKVVAAVSQNLEVVEDTGFVFEEDVTADAGQDTTTTEKITEQPEDIVIAMVEPQAAVPLPGPVVDIEASTKPASEPAEVVVVESDFEIFDAPEESATGPGAPSSEVITVAKPPQSGPGDPLAAPGATTVTQGAPQPVIRLAALTSTTRSIPLFNLNRLLRITGQEVSPDTEEGRAILNEIDPNLLKNLDAADRKITKDDVKSVQRELKRLGCYRSSIDGDWGKGSRTGLSRYFIMKKIVPDTLEPTLPLLRQLDLEENVVCEISVARTSAVRKAVEKTPAKAVKGIRRAQSKKEQVKIIRAFGSGVFR